MEDVLHHAVSQSTLFDMLTRRYKAAANVGLAPMAVMTRPFSQLSKEFVAIPMLGPQGMRQHF
jgi:hypothetical protein